MVVESAMVVLFLYASLVRSTTFLAAFSLQQSPWPAGSERDNFETVT